MWILSSIIFYFIFVNSPWKSFKYIQCIVLKIFWGEWKIRFYLINSSQQMTDSKNRQHLKASPLQSLPYYLRFIYPDKIKNKDL